MEHEIVIEETERTKIRQAIERCMAKFVTGHMCYDDLLAVHKLTTQKGKDDDR